MNYLKDERIRAWIYRIALAVIALAAAYGLLGPDEVPVWTAVVAAVLGIVGNGLATVNTSTKPEE